MALSFRQESSTPYPWKTCVQDETVVMLHLGCKAEDADRKAIEKICFDREFLYEI